MWPSTVAAVKTRLLWTLLVGAGCSGAAPEPAQRPEITRPTPSARAVAASVPLLDAHALATVPAVTYGPYTALGPHGALAIWAANEGGSRFWYGAALSTTGAPRGPAAQLAPAPAQLGVVIVRPLGAGFVVLGTRVQDGAEAVEASLLDAEGRLVTPPHVVAERSGQVLWLEALPTPTGLLVLGASSGAADAELWALELDAQTRAASTTPRVLVKRASAWQAAAVGDRIALAHVVAADKKVTGSVELRWLNAAGVVQGAPIVVQREPSAGFDLDMARVGDKVVLAWSDHRELEAQVFVAAADAAGKLVTAPRPAADPFGEQLLVRIVPPATPSSPAYLVWENLTRRPSSGRMLTLAPLQPDASLGAARGELDMAARDGSIPELEATSRGVAALTLAPWCVAGKDCSAEPQVPTFIAYDASLTPRAAEPIRLAELDGEPATLAWGLRCNEACFSLAALGTTPAPVFSVELEPKSNTWQAPGRKRAEESPPKPIALRAIARTEPLAALAAAQFGDALLTSWVTYFDPSVPYERLKKPAPDGRYDPLQAEVNVHAVSPDGAAAKPRNISLRARSVGGISMAKSPQRDEALVVWSAIDQGDPQVFATLVNKAGNKLAQRMVTRKKGEVSDVAVSPVDDGWLVSWVDERHGDAEVYAIKLNRALEVRGSERRLTQAPGAASGLTLLARGAEIWAVWSDAREAENPGWGDLFVVRLGQDGAPLGPEQRLFRTAAHSHSPVLAQRGDGSVVLAWIEGTGAAEAGEGNGAELRFAVLGDGATPGEHEPSAVRFDAGAPRTVSLDCAEASCNYVVMLDLGGRAEIAAGRWGAGALPPRSLVSLTRATAQAVAPVLIDDQVLYGDTVDGQGLVRQLTLSWP